jgi:iron complex transport system ATP-binding protein
VRINGTSLSKLSAANRAKQLALVQARLQSETALTLEEVIALGAWPQPVKACDSDVTRLLTQFNLLDLRTRRLDQVSDGERQKTMIARALMQNTPVVVMDEPTAFLDLPSRIEWWHSLDALRAAGKTLIISTHDLHLPGNGPKPDIYWILSKSTRHFASIDHDLSVDELLARLV